MYWLQLMLVLSLLGLALSWHRHTSSRGPWLGFTESRELCWQGMLAVQRVCPGETPASATFLVGLACLHVPLL